MLIFNLIIFFISLKYKSIIFSLLKSQFYFDFYKIKIKLISLQNLTYAKKKKNGQPNLEKWDNE